ncbi:unknown protein [Seminavis robusta]|uniref:Cdc37 N-terminal domain-containing protein n=1 Tax=Seminavis robusta TaxID=568900 RepID=A0A9N8EU79_9STRA|nr:unknown protein [Seminavis robusta]|eukprot:Sro1978_g309010.1 n/a (247) ;mRNA; r:5141-5881
MVIDYSRWDNLKLSDDEDEDEAPPNLTNVVDTRSAARPPQESGKKADSSLSREQVDFLPKYLILVHSKIRDTVLLQMKENGLQYANPVGLYGISLPTSFGPLDVMSFSSFFPGSGYDRGCKIVASLLSMSTEVYMEIIGNRERSMGLMAAVPYDAQFLGDPVPFGSSALHVRYGQERQGLYKKVPGPEFKECKMGPLCGGPIVLVQAKSQRGPFDTEAYVIEKVKVDEMDIPKVVTKLLDKPNAYY